MYNPYHFTSEKKHHLDQNLGIFFSVFHVKIMVNPLSTCSKTFPLVLSWIGFLRQSSAAVSIMSYKQTHTYPNNNVNVNNTRKHELNKYMLRSPLCASKLLPTSVHTPPLQWPRGRVRREGDPASQPRVTSRQWYANSSIVFYEFKFCWDWW